jgi:ADP-heptose:LPS heptosyltransferase
MNVCLFHMGGLGNTILLLPFLDGLYYRDANYSVTMILQDSPSFNLIQLLFPRFKLVKVQRNRGRLSGLFHLIRVSKLFFQNFHLVVNTSPIAYRTDLLYMWILKSSTSNLIGVSGDLDSLYDTKIMYRQNQSETALYQHLFSGGFRENFIFDLNFTRTRLKQALSIQKTVPIKGRVGIHPGSGLGLIYKRWAAKQFSELVYQLSEDGFHIVLFGGPGEEELALAIQKGSRSKLTNYAGKLSIIETAKKIAECEVFVTNDSGLMHLAGMLNLPVIAIFGPTNIIKNRPYGDSVSLLKSSDCLEIENALCQICHGLVRAGKRPKCLDEISVDQVRSALYERG